MSELPEEVAGGVEGVNRCVKELFPKGCRGGVFYGGAKDAKSRSRVERNCLEKRE